MSKVDIGRAMTVIAISILSASGLYFSGSWQQGAKASLAVQSPKEVSPQEQPRASETLNLTLARIDGQTYDAKTLRFLLERNQDLAARPGQFLTFDWMINGKPLSRSYSICSSPIQGGFVEITSKRAEARRVSWFLNDHAQAGLAVKARGPYGKFYFEEGKHNRIVLEEAELFS